MNYKALAKIGVVVLGGLGTCEGARVTCSDSNKTEEAPIVSDTAAKVQRIINDTQPSYETGHPQISLAEDINSEPAMEMPSKQELETQFSKDSEKLYLLLSEAGFTPFRQTAVSNTNIIYTTLKITSRSGKVAHFFALANPEHFDPNFKYNLVCMASVTAENETESLKIKYIRSNSLDELTELMIEEAEPTYYDEAN